MNKKYLQFIVPLLALSGLVAAGLLYVRGNMYVYNIVLLVTLVAGALPLLFKMIRDLLNGHFGVDLIAIVAIGTSFFLGQYLAGTVIVLMLSGGEALENYAMLRAQRELTHLLKRAPRTAHKKQGDQVVDVIVDHIQVEDMVVVKPGEIIPVDGVVVSGNSTVDESIITGESMPVTKQSSSIVMSGSVNEQSVLEIQATKTSHESKYQQIIELVKQAQESKAPIVRLADRYSVVFTVVTFAIAATAWFVSHDLVRVLSVLVVATPCPLILATPIAIISGISKAASRGIIIKNGGAIETLGEAKAFVFDKTGTLTLGEPAVTGVQAYGMAETEVLLYAASVDQLSAHILARSLVRYARKHHEKLLYPTHFNETLGQGVVGEIEGERFAFGKMSFIEGQGISISQAVREHHQTMQEQGYMDVYLAKGETLVGMVLFSDTIRPEAKLLFTHLKELGIRRNVMLTGDKYRVAEKIAKELHIGHFIAECLPEDKVAHVKALQREYKPVAMVGDGINDAPALATADVGIALGVGSGGTASSDAGDIVITVNSISRIADALSIARRVLIIAKQGIWFGMAVSIGLMVIASLGHIRPVVGALLQEVIDVIVILNALRVTINR